ncbi:helix-turn-helix transcriptional regulator [Mucilaginibacter dorajii]|uniref:HTH araC/xylS-type domain-containing protein n=1 Tax=Mucilaginibacter dorajii TaxID=692994 RepID=A0ABP7RA51_9SPHI|nr:AraC family transcriptional regulator [Mucilaginibacter dorajii]MCS3736718.1 AraC-like DNA-binding protein [Mucilaginibacter dorajii]
MRITFTSPSQKSRQLILDCPATATSDLLTERNSVLHLATGDVTIQSTWFSGACIIVSYWDIKKPSPISINCDCFCWILNFVIDGELAIQLSKKELALKAGRYHTFYSTLLNVDISSKCKSQMLSICLKKSFIEKLLGNNQLPAPFESNGDKHFTLITKGTYQNSSLSLLVNGLLNADQPVYIKRIFLEAKILELLSTQLLYLESRVDQTEIFSADDRARLQEAKMLIAQDLRSPCSLTELSRKTGLNDFKLKKGFKILFGNTVFGYLAELRMDAAYKLLQEGERVGIVAETVGYKNAHHFTAAFKKRFNVLPSQVLRLLLIMVNVACYV